ncbi:Peptidase S8 propeptide/proteinase inhibitor I9 - like 3, partial [Theobroma cacao]
MLSMSLGSAVANEDRKDRPTSWEHFLKWNTDHCLAILVRYDKLFRVVLFPNFLIGSYKRSFNGIAAKLTNQEAKELA